MLLQQEEDHWIPLSDLMTGLMMFFVLLAITFMVKTEADAKKIESDAQKIEIESSRIKTIAVLYDELRSALYRDLEAEFHSDLPKWGAELDKDLTVRFKEPEVLFDTGSDQLKLKFKTILDDFFPRYVRILTSAKYRNSIEEIRIEGHTSSFWSGAVGGDDAYFKNMALSQARTRTTLQYVLGIPSVGQEKSWLQKHSTANGLSSSKLILANGIEDPARSQRVEFRVRTDAESKIATIIETARQ